MAHSVTGYNHFQFFGKKEINSLYFTIGLYSFARGLIGVFVPIYFWEIGFSISHILLFYLLLSLSIVVLPFMIMPLLRIMSDKIMMFLSIPFLVLYFLGLGQIIDFPWLFYILPILAALNGILFNVGYHLDFSGSTNKDHVGTEVGKRYVISSLVQFSSPFLGGVLITFFGFQNTFIVATVILLFAILPLFFFKHRHISDKLNSASVIGFLTDKSLLPFNISGIAIGIDKIVLITIWPIFIFLTIGSIEKLGAIVSIGLLVGAIMTYFSGFLGDTGKRRRILTWSTIVYFIVWLTRPLFNTAIPVAVSHIAGELSGGPLMVSWSSQYYKIARVLDAPSIFILSREILYNLVRVVFLGFLIIFANFLPQGQFFTLSFILAAFASLLYLAANRLYIYDLDDFIIEGED